MSNLINVSLKIKPVLDPGFVPAALWNRAFRAKLKETGNPQKLTISLERNETSRSVVVSEVFPHEGEYVELNNRFAERLLKYLLWQKGGHKVRIAGDPGIAAYLKKTYSPEGDRAFDYEFMGEKIYGKPFTVEYCENAEELKESENAEALGGHMDGCRIGFDLGGSDRKCAAVIDGKVVHTEEVVWDPYFEKDPEFHFQGINDSLKRAAAKMPRVDCIGGSAAGVYVNNEVRVASLFRGVSPEDFKNHVERIFFRLQKEWGNVPFIVVNDGEVTALAGAMALEDGALLGVAMGTSCAAGYVNPDGNITDWLDELAFVPVDYRTDNPPQDEWSGDYGIGANYFSQQAIARLAPVAGIEFPSEMPFAERLVGVQKLMDAGDERARKIYETIGTYFGYNLAQYDERYELRNVLVLGRVMSGPGGDIILEQARKVMDVEFPELVKKVKFAAPDEKMKRHGQAVVAASLPETGK